MTNILPSEGKLEHIDLKFNINDTMYAKRILLSGDKERDKKQLDAKD